MSKFLYELRDVSFDYQLGKEKVHALQGFSLDIPSCEFVSLTGPSGSGKSTLLNILGLVEPLQSGTFLFAGRNAVSLSEAEKNKIRRFEIGFIFQSFHLLEVLSAEENVTYFLARQGVPLKQRTERAREALLSVGLIEHAKKKPLEMSGGQRQRVAVARALAKDPKVILADEPTANLDSRTGRELLELLRRLVDERNVSIVMSSHEPMVQEYCSFKVSLVDGRLESAGPRSQKERS
jgi:ABC-type lipoprotein export system ATPase subunit